MFELGVFVVGLVVGALAHKVLTPYLKRFWAYVNTEFKL